MDKKFQVSIFTPFGKYLVTDCDYLSTKTGVGVIGILANHAPLVSDLEISKLIIKNDNDTKIYAISGGVINIKKDHSVTLLVNSIERNDEIDVERAKAAQKRAEDRINNSTNQKEIQKAKISLLRALNRIDVSNNSL